MLNRLALDVPLVLEPNEVDFFTRATGLRDDALEEHIKSIQAKGYHDVRPPPSVIYSDHPLNQVTPFPCIRSFNFARFKISSHPIWPSVLARKDESDNLLLDLGCCFGTDVRKSIDDGWPSNAVLGVELMDCTSLPPLFTHDSDHITMYSVHFTRVRALQGCPHYRPTFSDRGRLFPLLPLPLGSLPSDVIPVADNNDAYPPERAHSTPSRRFLLPSL